MIGWLASLLISRNPALTVQYARRLAKIGVAVVAALLAVIAASIWFGSVTKKAEQRGATTQREADLRETIERVEIANEVRETVRRDGGAAYDECLRSSRTPANCVGLLPADQAD